MTLDKRRVTARQSSVPLLLTRIAFFETLSTAFVILFASHSKPIALPLTLVIAVIGIALNMTVHRAAVTALLESNVTPHLAMSFSRIFATIDDDRVLAKW